MLRRVLTFAALGLGLVAFGCWGTALYLESRLAERPLPQDHASPHLWRHRALTTHALKQAIILGYAGVEIDVRMIEHTLRAQHDHAPLGPPLSELLSARGDLGIWLDLKQMTDEEAHTLAVLLRHAGQRIFVEGHDAARLRNIASEAPMTHPILRVGAAARFRPSPQYLAMLWSLLRYNIDAVAWPKTDLHATAITKLRNLLFFIYTVNDRSELHDLPWQTAVVLTDSLQPQKP